MRSHHKLTLAAAVIGLVLGLVTFHVGLFAPTVKVPTAHAALGDVTTITGEVKAVEVLASATATNSPPSGASAGIAVNDLSLFGMAPEEAVLVIASTAGSGTMTATFRLWGEVPVGGGIWVPLGPGADATKGTLNTGSAIGETGTDTLRHSEVVEHLGLFRRLYVEITAIGGTSTAVTAWLVVHRHR